MEGAAVEFVGIHGPLPLPCIGFLQLLCGRVKDHAGTAVPESIRTWKTDQGWQCIQGASDLISRIKRRLVSTSTNLCLMIDI